MTRFNWTIEALDQVYDNGLTPQEVHQALAGPARRLIQPVNTEALRVIARTATGRLIEVWLRESPSDGEWDVWTAFEAGFVGHTRWKNTFGQE